MSLRSGFLVFTFVTLNWTAFCLGQIPEPAPRPPQGPRGTSSASEPLPGPQLSGSVGGTVVDQSGAVIAGAAVRLIRTDKSNSGDHPPNQEVLSGNDGQFSFANIAPGPFQLAITAAGFAPQTFSGILGSGEAYLVPRITMAVATNMADVEVGLSQADVADEQIQV